MSSNLWFKEWLTPHESHSHRIRNYVIRTQTPFQKAVIADTYSFGRCLILDGEIQSSQFDEFIYHESLVHPVLMSHPNPKTVLVLGGGEGATVRELLKHKSVSHITMVDIDATVLEFCKKHLRSWHKGSFTNEKLRLVVADAKTFAERTSEKFDIIISDLPSPTAGSPISKLYTLEFYRRLKMLLNREGLFVTQSGPGDFFQMKLHQVLYSTLQKKFKVVRPFYSHVPSFDGPWAFLIASGTKDPMKFDSSEIDSSLKKRLFGELSFYDGITHTGLFYIPKHLRTLLMTKK